ncbi:prepilin peptidase [Pseudomonas sp. FW300-N2F2]|uniref:A24 family peptidase n=1 Tax=Pseudomonas sp. FW300-N2F2 TaxID=2751320 RepID=UPI001A919089|nr:prepilin peptidase [Pseudomonas sp. FW300-N2F2]
MPSFAAAVLLPAVLWAALSDLLYRKIHNALVLVLLLGWLALPLLAALGLKPWPDLVLVQVFSHVAWSLLGGAVVLLVGYGLFALRRVGAGDVKLMAVLCLWMGYHEQVTFLIVTSLIGGLLALGLPLVELVERLLAGPLVALNRRFPNCGINPPSVLDQDRTPGIPYGIAIALGTVFTLCVHLPS